MLLYLKPQIVAAIKLKDAGGVEQQFAYGARRVEQCAKNDIRVNNNLDRLRPSYYVRPDTEIETLGFIDCKILGIN